MDPLRKILAPERLTAIVDVGANPIDGKPPYLSMLNAGLCTVVGFEPQQDALDKLLKDAGPNEAYLASTLGDGTRKTLNVLRCRGMSSILEPDLEHLKRFNDLGWLADVEGRLEVDTVRLDDVEEIRAMDFLKIDVQGAELEIFRNGRERLSSAVAVQTEVSFVQLYKKQPTFGDIDRELRSLGFIPHCLAEYKQWAIAPFGRDYPDWQRRRRGVKQIMEADFVYVRDFTDDGNMSPEQWKHLAMVAHHVYGSVDLVARCLEALGDTFALRNYCDAVSSAMCAA